jgi:hypothetical protein
MTLYHQWLSAVTHENMWNNDKFLDNKNPVLNAIKYVLKFKIHCTVK